MFSKSQARAFFVGGTVLCGAAFIALTVDTIGRVQAQTHADQITPAVERGKDLWDTSNCMGCHTLLGEGAYYAPELTLVYERRGPAFIKAMLRDPEKMYPGQRKMMNYDFKEGEIDDLVAFFQWVGKMDLNGFPPRPTLMPVATPPTSSGAPVAEGGTRPQVFNQLCVACHSIAGQGGNVGPALDGIGDRQAPDDLERWLQDPGAVKSDTKMPKLPLTEEQIREIVAFLSQQKSASQQKGAVGP